MASLITGNSFDPEKDIPSLSGKTFVLTGGSAGIGFGILAHLVQHGARKVYMLSSKKEHADEAMEEVKKYGDASTVEWKQANFESFAETEKVAKELKQELEKNGKLEGLICNAGLGVGKYNTTGDGIDSHFQVNHLSQVVLALTLLPILQATPHSRLVFEASDLHRAAPSSIKWESLDEINTDIGPSYLYNRTKLAQVQFVIALQRRADMQMLGFTEHNYKTVFMNAVHPGAVSTDQPKQAEDAYGTLGTIAVAVNRPFMKDPMSQGCRPALFAATSEDIIKENITGKYIVPDRKDTDPSSQALDQAMQEKLWILTMNIIKEKVPSLKDFAA